MSLLFFGGGVPWRLITCRKKIEATVSTSLRTSDVVGEAKKDEKKTWGGWSAVTMYVPPFPPNAPVHVLDFRSWSSSFILPIIIIITSIITPNKETMISQLVDWSSYPIKLYLRILSMFRYISPPYTYMLIYIYIYILTWPTPPLISAASCSLYPVFKPLVLLCQPWFSFCSFLLWSVCHSTISLPFSTCRDRRWFSNEFV